MCLMLMLYVRALVQLCRVSRSVGRRSIERRADVRIRLYEPSKKFRTETRASNKQALALAIK
jgi:hypothetical protein